MAEKNELVYTINPLFCVACKIYQLLLLKPQVDFVLGSLWSITPVDDISVHVTISHWLVNQCEETSC